MSQYTPFAVPPPQALKIVDGAVAPAPLTSHLPLPVGERPCSRQNCSNRETICCDVCNGPYCSRTCQLLDWALVHVRICKPVPGSLSVEAVRKSCRDYSPALPYAIAEARDDFFRKPPVPDIRLFRGGAFMRSQRPSFELPMSPDSISPPPPHLPPPMEPTIPRKPFSMINAPAAPPTLFHQPPPVHHQPPPLVRQPVRSAGRIVASSRASTPLPRPAANPWNASREKDSKDVRRPQEQEHKLPDVFAKMRDLRDLYAENELVDILITNQGPQKDLFWGYLIPIEDDVKRSAFDAVMLYLPKVNQKWRPIGTAKFGDRIMFRDKKVPTIFRGTVLSPSQQMAPIATVFCDDFGFMSLVTKTGEVTDLDPSRRFPALAFAFMNVAADFKHVFEAEARSPGMPNKMKQGRVTRGVDEHEGDLIVTFEAGDGAQHFVARRWFECVGVSVKIGDVPIRATLKPGSVTEGAVSHYSYPDPFIYCYEAADVGYMADLTDALVLAFSKMDTKSCRWEISDVGMCEDNYGTVARFVVERVLDACTLRVRFFDFGDTDTRDISQCRPLPINLAMEPIKLITFGLDCGASRLSKEACEYVAGFCDGKGTVRMVTTRINADNMPTGDIVPVDSDQPTFLEFLREHPRRLMWNDDVQYKKFEVGSLVNIVILDDTFNCPEVFDFAGIVENRADRIHEQTTLDALVDLHAKADDVEHAAVHGELVLAQDDGAYYRAVAVNEFKVWFLDYGNSTNVTRADVRKLPENFIHTPPFVHLFRFHDHDEASEELKISRLQEMIKRGTLHGKVTKCAEDAPVVYVDIFGV